MATLTYVCSLWVAAYSAFLTLWPAHLKEQFSFTAGDYALYFAVIGAVSSLSQGYFAPWVITRCSHTKHLLLLCVVVVSGARHVVFYVDTIGYVYFLACSVLLFMGEQSLCVCMYVYVCMYMYMYVLCVCTVLVCTDLIYVWIHCHCYVMIQLQE
jgi:hypothetical protein